MAGELIPVLCYWGRSTFIGPMGFSFEGSPKTAIMLNANSNYHELLNKIYCVMKLDKTKFNMKINFRCPTTVYAASTYYTSLEINDDSLMEVMLSVFKRMSSITMLELFVEVEPVTTATVGDPDFPLMSTQDSVVLSQCTPGPSRLYLNENHLRENEMVGVRCSMPLDGSNRHMQRTPHSGHGDDYSAFDPKRDYHEGFVRDIDDEGAFDNLHLDDEALVDDEPNVEVSEECEDPTPIRFGIPDPFWWKK